MLKFGLQDDDNQIILDIFKAYPQVDEVILFGSRALNTFKATSDVDLAIKGKDIHTILAALINDFEESDLIYEVDVLDYASITSEKLLGHIDRHGKVFYRKGWVETTLGENIVDIAMGPFGSNLKVDSFTESGVPVIKGGNLSENYVGGSFSFVSEEKAASLKRSVAHAGDIIVTHRGTLGQVSLVPSGEYKRYVTSQSQLRFSPDKKKVDKRYLLYFLKSRVGQYELLLNSSQVGVPAISTPTKAVKEIRLFLPPLPEQKAIAAMLSSFDKKIALLREQNKTLEILAQTIFKEWFVNLKDGKSIPLSELIEFNPIEKIDRKREYLFFDMKTLPTNSMAISEGVFKKSNSGTSFREEDTLFAKITPCLENGKTAFVLDLVGEVVARGSTEFIVMRAKEKGSPYLNYCICRDNKFREYAVQSMTGTSGRQRVPVDRLKTYEIQYSQENISKFNDAAKSCFEKIKNNAAQIQSLSKTRDVLLPKLMAGKVRVSDES